jgi:hypothetical protein
LPIAIKSESELKENIFNSAGLVIVFSRLIRSWIVEMNEDRLKCEIEGKPGNGNRIYL